MAINAFLNRTRAGSKIISPIGLELESPAFSTLAMPGRSGISPDLIEFFREQIIQICWKLRGKRQVYVAALKQILRKSFVEEDARKWNSRFKKPSSSKLVRSGNPKNPVCELLQNFFSSKNKAVVDAHKWMLGFELYLSQLHLSIEAYCLIRNKTGWMSPDAEMLEQLGWKDDWMMKLQKIVAERFSFVDYYLVHSDIRDMLYGLIENEIEEAIQDFLFTFSEWQKRPHVKTYRENLINSGVILKLCIDEFDYIGNLDKNLYMNKVEQLLRGNSQVKWN